MISPLIDAQLSDADPVEIRRLERLDLFREKDTPWLTTRANGSHIPDAIADDAFCYYRDYVIPAREKVAATGYVWPFVRYYLATVRTWALMLESNPLEET